MTQNLLKVGIFSENQDTGHLRHPSSLTEGSKYISSNDEVEMVAYIAQTIEKNINKAAC